MTTAEDLPSDEEVAVTRSVMLPTDLDDATDALLDPERLAAWIGPWQQEPGTGKASVTTDDGTLRCVEDHRVDEHGNVRWSWHPVEEPTERSDVLITLTPLEEQSTLVTIHETRPTTFASAQACAVQIPGTPGVPRVPAAAGLPDRWLPCVLALGAVCASRLLVSM